MLTSKAILVVLTQVLRRERKTVGLRVRLQSTPTIDNARSDTQTAIDDLSGDVDLERRDRGDDNDDDVSQSNVDNGNVVRSVVCRDVLFDDSAQDVISALGAPGKAFQHWQIFLQPWWSP